VLFQSERSSIYKEEIQKLLDNGGAYRCFLTKEELELARDKAKKDGGEFRVPKTYRNKSFSSPVTGSIATIHHTPWASAMDDSSKAFLNQSKK